MLGLERRDFGARLQLFSALSAGPRFTKEMNTRRLIILVVAILASLYAIAVLAYVRSIPEIGLRFGFGTNIQHVDLSALRPDQGPLPVAGDFVKAIGNDFVIEHWGHVQQRIAYINDEHQEPIESWTPHLSAKTRNLLIDGEHWVWVQYQRNSVKGNEKKLASAWARVDKVSFEALLPSILWFFLKGGLFVIGAWVLWKRPNDRSALQFFLLCMVTCNAFMGGYHWQRIATQPLLLTVFMASGILLPALSLHFYLIFPRPKTFVDKWYKTTFGVIYGIPTFFLILICSTYVVFRLRQRGELSGDPEEALRAILYAAETYFAIAALWYVACVVSLILSYRNAANPVERNQVKCILLGAMAALVPIGYTLYLAFWEKNNFAGGAATWPMFAASVCLNIAYAVSITRYRLMQLDQLISSGVVYFLFSFLAGLVYYILVFVGVLVVGSKVMAPSFSQALWVSSTVLVLMIILDLVRGRLKKALDQHFRREKYQLDRTLRRMSQAIEQLVDPPTLARRLLHVSGELLGVSQGAVFLREGDLPLFRLTDHLGSAPALTEVLPGCPLVEALTVCGTLVDQPRPLPHAERAHRQMRLLGGQAAQAVVHKGDMLALLVLGQKEGGAYTTDDLNVLAAFAQMTALALASAERHCTIESLNQDLRGKVAKIAEQQKRIANLQSQLVSKARIQARVAREVTGAEKNALEVDKAANPPDVGFNGLDTSQGFVGSSPQVQGLLHHIRKVAGSSSAVLLRGESGTGKEVLARVLHESSPRAGKAFVKVHCAALSPTLLESELFGHVKGAFTGAHKDKIGRFESAHGGTLFLDEIGDISLEVQTKLLRVLQEKIIERVGSNQPVEVDVRLISATHQDLERLIREGRFRDDLYYRLNVISVTVPPLRERREDIPELAAHFLRLYGGRSGKEGLQIDDDALLTLKAYSWPGNIRQLENVMERAVVVAEGLAITVEDLPVEILYPTDPFEESSGFTDPGDHERGSSKSVLVANRIDRRQRELEEREQLVRTLAATKGNKAEAARALGMARSTLFSRLRKHGLS
jgi:transcriptional regulator with GAF, ATPase, and Fis domain